MKDYSRNIMPHLLDLEPDEAGPDPLEVSAKYGIPPERIVVLSRNENPYCPSPKVWEALKSTSLNRYPDSRPFVEALSKYTGYPAENIVTGAGMDEIIITMSRLFLGPGDKALIPIPTYTLYGLAARLCGALPLYQQRLPSFEIDPEMTEGVKVAFLCTPNNPTGNSISEERLRQIVESTEAIVFLDEAYAEFTEKSLLKLVEEYDNLVVGRTLSKAFALAGMRLGYAVAPEWIAEQYRRISPLFSISSISLAAGVAALDDLDYMRRSASMIISERERVREEIEGAIPSDGNFLFIRTKEKSG
ncbi:MAG TPA: histidinol-phosphate transaminase, partial [Methanotrichaceae archaeon]|nr:histidinol-phosphate transaminase [Methanotrichaceae archaeon]